MTPRDLALGAILATVSLLFLFRLAPGTACCAVIALLVAAAFALGAGSDDAPRE